jgi:hypothetical protein
MISERLNLAMSLSTAIFTAPACDMQGISSANFVIALILGHLAAAR